jgi:prephenate dehydratase
MAIAIQGERGSFSHEAALVFQPQASIHACTLSPEAFRSLEAGEVDAAVLPIENSLAGSVVEHYDLLWQHDVKAEREIRLRIKHYLIGMPGSEIETIHRVYSHPVALAQVRRFLAEHPHMEAVPFYDTAGSVKQLMELRDRHSAGVASLQAAVTYGGQVLASGIEDDPENYTRFLVLRRPEDIFFDPLINKLSLAFTVAHQPGTLVGALEVLASEKANLTKIQSRPVHGQPWHYVFYVDCLVTGHEMADRVLEGLRAYCSVVKELGRYQAANE